MEKRKEKQRKLRKREITDMKVIKIGRGVREKKRGKKIKRSK